MNIKKQYLFPVLKSIYSHSVFKKKIKIKERKAQVNCNYSVWELICCEYRDVLINYVFHWTAFYFSTTSLHYVGKCFKRYDINKITRMMDDTLNKNFHKELQAGCKKII